MAVSFVRSFSLAQTQSFTTLSAFDVQKVKSSRLDMDCYLLSQGGRKPISRFTADMKLSGKTIAVYTSLQFTGSADSWTDTSIANAADLKPVYRSSYHGNQVWALQFGKSISGFTYDKKSKKRTTVNPAAEGAFIDSYLYPYILNSLPLNSGYRASLPVFDFKPEKGGLIKPARVEEVRSSALKSSLTGEHKVWLVTVFEETTNEKYEYSIDKSNGRIRKIEIYTPDQHILMEDRESDYNPFKSTFDYAATLSMIKDGQATIKGQAFARDNQASIKGIAILNVNKKQYAQQGTVIVLIPYTNYYKEWIKINDAGRKKGTAYPLSKEAAACIKTTTVYDEDGNFEFTNLKPGEYLLYTEFMYIHRSTHTEVIGYTDTYINGMFSGSYANTNSYSVDAEVKATVKKTIEIKKPDEKVSVKLKKTL